MKLLIASLAVVVLFGLAEGRQCEMSKVAGCLGNTQMSDICGVFNNIDAISSCIDLNTKDCDQDQSMMGFTSMVNTIKTNTTMQAMCAPGCEDLPKKTITIANCMTTMVQEMGDGSDEEKACGAYNKMLKCTKAAAGKCKALKDKMQEQLDQTAKQMGDKCSGATGLAVSTMLMAIVAFIATKFF